MTHGENNNEQLEYIATLLYLELQGDLTIVQTKELEAWKTAFPDRIPDIEALTDPDAVIGHVKRLQEVKDYIDTGLREKGIAIGHDNEKHSAVILTPDFKSAANDLTADTYSELPPPIPRIPFFRTALFRYVAIILLLIGAGAYLWFQSSRPQMLAGDQKRLQTDIPPGRNGAILTLADGRQLVLDSIGDGTIATQNGTEILLSNNQLVYDASAATGKISNNTITTPKGRQFHIFLPDGTKVWLNAASSIEYPVAFNGKERRVKISGELYFDVANKSWQPFIVETDNLKVEVLGTSFNINSYADEKIVQTTLLTGAVKLIPLLSNQHIDSKGDKNQYKILIPGQTAVLDKTAAIQAGPSLKITDTQDLSKITAWKDGLFNFDGVDLFSVMRQLERWYNIEVHYVGKPDNVIFKGKMYRNTNLTDLLKVLETMEVNFELKGNILYVR